MMFLGGEIFVSLDNLRSSGLYKTIRRGFDIFRMTLQPS
jgi:hypothetical protein